MAEKMSRPSIPHTQSPQPKKIIRAAPSKQDRNLLWQGLVFYFTAILVVTFGVLGYLTYDEYIEPNLNIFVCCIPSIIIAIILIFFGFSTRMNVIRTVRQPQVIIRKVSDQHKDPEVVDIDGKTVKVEDPVINKGLKKYQAPKYTKEELIQKKENLSDFITNLEEQHKSGLLYDETYLELKTKYQIELNDINTKLKNIKLNKSKPKK
jgi:hypothetical protein